MITLLQFILTFIIFFVVNYGAYWITEKKGYRNKWYSACLYECSSNVDRPEK